MEIQIHADDSLWVIHAEFEESMDFNESDTLRSIVRAASPQKLEKSAPVPARSECNPVQVDENYDGVSRNFHNRNYGHGGQTV